MESTESAGYVRLVARQIGYPAVEAWLDGAYAGEFRWARPWDGTLTVCLRDGAGLVRVVTARTELTIERPAPDMAELSAGMRVLLDEWEPGSAQRPTPKPGPPSPCAP